MITQIYYLYSTLKNKILKLYGKEDYKSIRTLERNWMEESEGEAILRARRIDDKNEIIFLNQMVNQRP